MRPLEINPKFKNPLVHSASLYLRQHAHNPVFWYPWSAEAIELARAENKPILVSIGYSSCYWCHVMEREVFENPTIAAQMNEHFINIKIDREEYPHLDEIYMVARQMITRQGGWPNNVFLTPQLEPFYAGGTFAAAEQSDRPSFPRVLEWLNYIWTTQEKDVRETAQNITKAIQGYLQPAAEKSASVLPISQQADRLYLELKKYQDESSGGFFQAPKFPHEHYLSYLLAYHEHTKDEQALDIVSFSLRKMAAGGIYDHVGCGFHRYAVDKEWYVPHFEKMLYNQAMLARVYTDAARITGNPWFADIARSILEFVLGPMTDGNGGFYASIDAETEGVEGAYYAWSSEELQSILAPEEANFLVTFYALADIPKFPGHKHPEGQALIARKGLDEAAREKAMPYVQLSAMCGHVMNKLLTIRNTRIPPVVDTKIIVAWNGLMIDAFAHAGMVFSNSRYIEAARKAVDFLLEHAIDKESNLCRIYFEGQAGIEATLEDYACLIKGLLTLQRATGEPPLLDAALSLLKRADELFYDKKDGSYFFTQPSDFLLTRIKSGDDGTLPSANAVMLHNLTTLHAITGDAVYRERAERLRDFFLGIDRPLMELSGLMQSALLLEPSPLEGGGREGGKWLFVMDSAFTSPPDSLPQGEGEPVIVTTALFPSDAKPGETCELIITLDIKDGWHVNANRAAHPFLIPTQADVQGQGVELVEMVYPQALRKKESDPPLHTYEGLVNLTGRIKLTGKGSERPPIKLKIRFQPCTESACRPVRDVSLTV